jgi:hypothetical protein
MCFLSSYLPVHSAPFGLFNAVIASLYILRPLLPSPRCPSSRLLFCSCFIFPSHLLPPRRHAPPPSRTTRRVLAYSFSFSGYETHSYVFRPRRFSTRLGLFGVPLDFSYKIRLHFYFVPPHLFRHYLIISSPSYYIDSRAVLRRCDSPLCNAWCFLPRAVSSAYPNLTLFLLHHLLLHRRLHLHFITSFVFC